MLEFDKLTLKNVLKNSCESYPNRPAFSWVDGEPYTYLDIKDKVEDLSLFLRKQGIIVGEKVAILGENSPNWCIAYFSITTMGAIAVPILTEFHDNEIHHIMRHCGAKAIFVSEKLFGKIEELEIEKSNTIILLDDFSIIPPETTKERLKQLISSGTKEFAKLKESALKIAGMIPLEVQEDNIASIIYTSGTTGHSKGVMLSHKNIVFDANETLKTQEVNEYDRLLSVLPLPHAYECTIGFILPFIKGAAIYYLKKPPTASVLIPAMKKIEPTMILTVPLIIEKIFKLKILPALTKSPLSRALYKIPFIKKSLHGIAGKKLHASFGGKLHFFGIGGALLAPEVERFLLDAKFPYAIGYELTETSPVIAASSLGKTRYRSTGPCLDGIQLKIENPDPSNGEGEILIKGDSVMKGYYKNPEITRQVFTEDGWFKTGDLGMLDRDNYLYIKGRLKNVIVGPSGENIYPEEIEGIINENEYVTESLVFEQAGRIVARIHLNYELLDHEHRNLSSNEAAMRKIITELLDKIKSQVNSSVSSFSRLTKIIEQTEPFDKTPTKKIKRYLYTG
ncbi:MAG: AMP-binding protein [Thermodesulfobacteriota bacterium]|nr:AMP-binding protein [Thermodesulfobacteriota bacterium]